MYNSKLKLATHASSSLHSHYPSKASKLAFAYAQFKRTQIVRPSNKLALERLAATWSAISKKFLY